MEYSDDEIYFWQDKENLNVHFFSGPFPSPLVCTVILCGVMMTHSSLYNCAFPGNLL